MWVFASQRKILYAIFDNLANTLSSNATAAAAANEICEKNPNRIQVNAIGELMTIVIDASIL